MTARDELPEGWQMYFPPLGYAAYRMNGGMPDKSGTGVFGATKEKTIAAAWRIVDAEKEKEKGGE